MPQRTLTSFTFFLLVMMQNWLFAYAQPPQSTQSGQGQAAPAIQNPSGGSVVAPSGSGTELQNASDPSTSGKPPAPDLVRPPIEVKSQGSEHRGRYLEVLEQGLESRRDLVNFKLVRFGSTFFIRSKEELTHSDDGIVPSDYVLRPGDELQVVTYNTKGGESTSSIGLDQNGQAYVPQVGPTSLGGLTLGQAQAQLNGQVQSKSSNFRVRLSMTKIRKIRVFILGEAGMPGSILMNPGSTLLDGLLAGGGPSNSGSYRKIQLQRSGRIYATYDLYQLFLKGITESPRLMEGDRIFIPPAGSQIAVAGEVARPAFYEVLNESNLGQVMRLAGGLKPEADKRQILIERMSDNVSRKLRDVNYSEINSINIKNGDTVTVKPLLEELANAIYIQGAVKRPGWYSVFKGITVSQLLAKAQGLKDGVFPGRSEIYRRKGPDKAIEIISFNLGDALGEPLNPEKNPTLQSRDTLIVYEVRDNFVNVAQVRVQGEVASPGEYPRFTNMRLRDLLFQAGGVSPEASDLAEIASRGTGGELRRREVSLTGVLADPSSPDNVVLGDLDTVIVRKALRARRWPATIRVSGEVYKPGVYTIDPERENLRDVVARAGGLTERAFPRGTVFIRQKGEILEPAQEKLTRDIFDLLQNIANKFAQAEENRRGSGRNATGAAINDAYSSALLPILAKGGPPGGIREIDRILTSTRVPLNLTQVIGKASIDPGVRDGDTLHIPPEPQVVVVAGAVIMPSPILFADGRSVDDYLRLAGGITADAASDKIFVIGVDGAITKKDEVRRLEKGDVIIVPPEPIVASSGAFETFISLAQIALNALFLGRILQP